MGDYCAAGAGAAGALGLSAGVLGLSAGVLGLVAGALGVPAGVLEFPVGASPPKLGRAAGADPLAAFCSSTA